MVVIIAGMYRSGSTFTYNIVRELLQADGKVDSYACDSFDELLLNPPSEHHIVIKTHQPCPLMTHLIKQQSIKCVASIRKPEDAIASWVNVFNASLEDSVIIVKDWIIWHATVVSQVLNIQYAAIDGHPYLTVLRIQWYLFKRINILAAYKLYKKYNKEKLKKELDALTASSNTTDAGFSYYDNTTLFHRKHISSVKSQHASKLLSAAQLQQIRAHLGEFIDTNGQLLLPANTHQIQIEDKPRVKFTQILEERDAFIAHLQQGLTNKDEDISHFNRALLERDAYIQHLERTIDINAEDILNFKTVLMERDKYITHLEQSIKTKT